MRASAASRTAFAAVLTASLVSGSTAFVAAGHALISASTRRSHDHVVPTSSARPRSSLCMSRYDPARDAAGMAAALIAGVTFLLSGSEASLADGSTQKFSLPPISQAKDRCVFKSSAMGQANAARDKLYDLRQCDLSGKSAAGFDLSGVLASEADFSKGDFKEVVMSKAYARNSNWESADFTNAVVDRVSFDGSSMKGAIFQNAVLTSTSFTDANVEDVDFTEAYMGEFDQRNLCKNPTLKGTNPTTNADTRESVGCP